MQTKFKVAKLDAIPLRVPFRDFVDGPRSVPQAWREFDMLLVRAETTDGVVGWGECFAYSCLRPVHAAVQDMVFPLVIGREITDIGDLNRELQFKLHIFGRYGIGIFAISGLDIALWDIAAKMSGQSLSAFTGSPRRESVQAYASLIRYGEPSLVERIAARAVGDGYRHVKLHEISLEAITAGRRAVGADISLMTDVNCNWSVAHAEAMLPKLKELDPYWVEEPIFPPEDFETLAALNRFGVRLAAGENACTAMEFVRLTEAVTFPQPSVTKVGGITEFLKVAAHAKAAGKSVMPHSPYFGPGYWATLQLAAILPEPSLFEFLYVETDAWLNAAMPRADRGRIAISTALGIGCEPDQKFISRFQVY
jgi:L-alanine-DL-glutamate epimerase-like enolase superfamily enzyme